MRLFFTAVLITAFSFGAFAQKHSSLLKGMYLQWGYNTEWYTKSNIHIRRPDGTNFTLHHVKANDRPDMDAILTEPGDISIPQYNYRIGFYLNKSHTKALEINFDHAKYIVTNGQTVHVTGTIGGKPADGDSIMDPDKFMHFEHTDGANWLHINYVRQRVLLMTKNNKHPLISFVWKLGAGINIPRTDFTWKGDRQNNDFHVAGYNLGAEAGARIYPLKKFFFEFTGKTGFVQYINALCNSQANKGTRARHSFGYFELIGLIGYDINF